MGPIRPEEIKFAVVIAGRNAEATVDRALKSIEAQKLPPDEVWFVDDASEDATVSRVRKYEGRINNLKVVVRKTQGGPGSARNEALWNLQSDYMLPLDADDALKTEAIFLFAERLKKGGHIDLLYGDITERRGQRVIPIRYPEFKKPLKYWRLLLFPRIPFKHSAMCIGVSMLRKLGGYSQNLKSKFDVDIFLKFAQAGCQVKGAHQIIADHYVHAGQMSRRRWAGMVSLIKIIFSLRICLMEKIIFSFARCCWEIGKMIQFR